MTKEELIQFLKDNLEIDLDVITPERCNGVDIVVELKLSGELISESKDYIQF